jgi:hypothetical protein
MVFLGMILGFIVFKEGKLPNPKKIQVIINMPPFKNCQQIQVFNGMAQFYRCFIKTLLLLWHLSLNSLEKQKLFFKQRNVRMLGN